MNSKSYEEAVLKGIMQARKEINNTPKKRRLKKVTPLAASIGIVGLIGLAQPEVAKAVQEMTHSFAAFSGHLFGSHTERFQEVAKMIGVSQTSKESIITLDEVILDDNLLMIALTVDSHFLAGYEGLNENDFFDLDYYLFVNGKSVSSTKTKIRQVDETTGAIIIEATVTDLNLKDNANIDLRISQIKRGFESLNGTWNFDFKVDLLAGGERLTPDSQIEYEKTTIFVDEIVTSQLANNINLMVTGELTDEVLNQLENIVIEGSNEQIYEVDSFKGIFSHDNKEANLKLRIDSNWSNLEWIKIYPRTSEPSYSFIKEDIWYELYQTPEIAATYDQYQVLTRKPTEDELNAGFALEEINYYVNLTNQTEFKPLDKFVGDEIWVNSTQKVVIKEVILAQDEVKIVFQLPTTYLSSHLTSCVLFDEELNDYARREGQLVLTTEDEEARLYSVILDQIDTSKAYTIAIPLIPEVVDEDPAWSLKIPLK